MSSPNRKYGMLLALLVLPVFFFSVSGCMSIQGGQQSIADESKVSQIRKGKSTKVDIMNLFGEPGGKSFEENGDEVWVYMYTKTSVDPKTYIPIVGAFAGGASSKTNNLSIVFAKNGVVKSYSTNTAGVDTTH